MPRRKQNCPKRMKLEEERRGKASKSAPDGENDAEEDESDEGEDDDEEPSEETAMIETKAESEKPVESVSKSEESRTRKTVEKPRKKCKKRGKTRGKTVTKVVQNDEEMNPAEEDDRHSADEIDSDMKVDETAEVDEPASPEKPTSPSVPRAKTLSPTPDITNSRSILGKRSRGLSFNRDDQTAAMEVDEEPPEAATEAPVEVKQETKPELPLEPKSEEEEDSEEEEGGGSSSPLDFSVRRDAKPSASAKPDDDDDDEEARLNSSDGNGDGENGKSDGPLDLSVPRGKNAPDLGSKARKRAAESVSTKTPDSCDDKKKMRPFPSKEALPWVMNPELSAAAMSMGLPMGFPGLAGAMPSPGTNLWNGKANNQKMSPGEKHNAENTSAMDAALDSMKALERMQDLTRISNSPQVSQLFGQLGAWHSPWFTQNRSAASAAVVAAAAAAVSASQDPTTRDILRCVWCHQSFPTFNDLSVHMRDAKHCGPGAPPPMAGRPQPTPPAPPMASPRAAPSPSPVSPSVQQRNQKALPTTSSASGLSLKETMPLPRKLVRGQDVWLGKGAEQTRQILKCMWCGQSFKSLADMTTHMQQTQHYTNIISQEQIISWKSPEDKASNQSHVSAVLTCKVCNQGFSSLKDLSSHMVKNSHYKEHMMRSISESGSRRRQAREKRKKSLPVRKLLEIERAQSEVRPQTPGSPNVDFASRGSSPQAGGTSGLKFPQTRIPCERCGVKVFAASLFDHLKKCNGNLSAEAEKDKTHPNLLMSALLSAAGNANEEFDKKSLASDAGISSDSSDVESSQDRLRIPTPSKGEGSKAPASERKTKEKSPSVLNALEKLIEKSFDSHPQRQQGTSALGSSILKRLGIDETVDCSKPLMDQAALAAFTLEQQNALGFSQLAALKAMDPRMVRKLTSFSPRSSADDDVSDHESAASDFGPDAASSAKEDEDEEEEKTVKKSEAPVCLKKELPPLRRVASPIEVKRENTEPSRWKGIQKIKQEEGVSKVELASMSPRSSIHGDDIKSEPDCHCDKPEGKCRCHGMSDVGSPNGSDLHDGESARPKSTQSGQEEPTSKSSSSNPLAALQMLCEKTETNNMSSRGPGGPQANGAGSGLLGAGLGTQFPGAILAFSWACNDAIVNSDSIMKCAFCDTPFISKGAYRHHLSKMHFVKDGMMPDPYSLKSGGSKPPSPGVSGAASGSGNKFPPAASPASSSSSSTSPHPQPSASTDDSPHAKFLKYTEMAKQLSSKYV